MSSSCLVVYSSIWSVCCHLTAVLVLGVVSGVEGPGVGVAESWCCGVSGVCGVVSAGESGSVSVVCWTASSVDVSACGVVFLICVSVWGGGGIVSRV